MGRGKRKYRIKTSLLYIVLTVFIALYMFPIVWLFFMSIKPDSEIFASPPVWLTQNPTLVHFSMLFSHFKFGTALTNSLITGTASTLLTVALSTLAAYGLSRYNFRGSNMLLLSLVFVRMTVPASLVVPLYNVLDTFNLINTPIALIIGQLTWTLPFSIWLLKGFFDALPRELEEAAYIDGASTLRLIRSVVLPIAAPGIAVATIFAFMTSWSEFLFAASFATSYKVSTTSIAAMITRYKVYWGEIAAGGIIFSIPSIIVAAGFQQYFVKGLTVGAVKG